MTPSTVTFPVMCFLIPATTVVRRVRTVGLLALEMVAPSLSLGTSRGGRAPRAAFVPVSPGTVADRAIPTDDCWNLVEVPVLAAGATRSAPAFGAGPPQALQTRGTPVGLTYVTVRLGFARVTFMGSETVRR